MNTRFSTLDIIEDDELMKSIAQDLENNEDKPLTELLKEGCLNESDTGRIKNDSKDSGESQN